MTAAIEFENVHFSYDGEAPAIDGVSFTVAPGEFVCLLGGNGSGKSTLVRLINGLLCPDEGTVRVFGHHVVGADEDALLAVRAQVGMVFQNPDDQLVASVVENEVAFGPENLGLPAPEIRRRVSEALDTVGLAGFEGHHVMELSGGQKQRVAIAGALALRPRLLVLDEACAMLDPMGRAGLLRVVKRLNREGMTIVMITHAPEELACATRCVLLEQGRIARIGAPDDFVAGMTRERGLAQLARVEARAEACAAARAAMDTATASASCDAAPACDAAAACVLAARNVSFAYGKPKRTRRTKAHGDTKASSSQTTSSAFVPAVSEGAVTPRWGGDPCEPWALREVSFEVHAGEVFGIAGHTGSGKSTLALHLNGLLKPTEGRILFEGIDLSDKHRARRACGRVGLVFQYPEHQLFAPTVAQDVAFGPRNLGLPEDEIARRVDEALERVGVPLELANRSPFELSGGQQRRVALAGVLAMHPEVLVLDEPAAGLDAEGHRMLLNLVRDFCRAGRTVVVISHDMDDLAALCTRVLVLNQGRVFALGTPQEVLRDAQALRAIGLDVPHSVDTLEQGANAPAHDANAPGHSANTPAQGASTPKHDANAPGHSANTPAQDANASKYDASTPERGASTPKHDANAQGQEAAL